MKAKTPKKPRIRSARELLTIRSGVRGGKLEKTGSGSQQEQQGGSGGTGPK